jgi:uncharacterized protein YegP (UPF0339 family)
MHRYNPSHSKHGRAEQQEKTLRPEKGGTMAGTFELKKAKDSQFYCHLKASNGQIILVSETYTEKASHQGRTSGAAEVFSSRVC